MSAMARADEQRQIISEEFDLNALRQALRSFTGLKQIRVMRVVDKIDSGWAIFLRNNPAYADEATASEQVAASEHAISTLYGAIDSSVSTVVQCHPYLRDGTRPAQSGVQLLM